MEKNRKVKKIVIVLFIIMIVLIGLFTFLIINKNKKVSKIQYQNDIYKCTYDSTWKLKEEKNVITLKNSGTTGEFSIYEKKLEDRYILDKVDYFIENIKVNLQNDNPSYNLIYESNKDVTENGYNGYQLLYEDENKQVLVTILKRNNELIIMQYTADNKYFDILLDNVKNIMWSFKLLDKN